MAISIHAPVKGATLIDVDAIIRAYISIHAPVKGATGVVIVLFVIVLYFNPRSREGSDHAQTGRRPGTTDFNPRSREGSDMLLAFAHADTTNFNPRSREGSDLSLALGFMVAFLFQSTLP